MASAVMPLRSSSITPWQARTGDCGHVSLSLLLLWRQHTHICNASAYVAPVISVESLGWAILCPKQ